MTQPVFVLDPTQLLSLNCLVLGDDLKKVFTVKIDKTENVSILKKLIKEENAPHLDHLAPSELNLWMFDRHLNELGAEPAHVNLDAYSKLSPPNKKLSFFFNYIMDDDHLHIRVIAETPGTLR